MTFKHHKLAIFDIDGTIASAGNIPPEVTQGIKHLQDLGYTTTISTGRGYLRIRELFGDLFETLISPDALIISEHGTKIVHRDGSLEFAEYLEEEHIRHILDFIRANIEIIKLVWFNPAKAGEKLHMWVYDERDLAEERQHRGEYAQLMHGSIGRLGELLLSDRISNVTAKLREHVQVHNLKLVLTHTPLELTFVDGNLEFSRNNANKGLAVHYLLRKYGLHERDLLVAGNAINDVEMLDIAAARRVVVGSEEAREPVIARLSDRENLILIDSPLELGRYLQKLSE